MVKSAEKLRAEDQEARRATQAIFGLAVAPGGAVPVPDGPPAPGVANAARMSRGSFVDHWKGLTVKELERDRQPCTVTVQLYHTVSGGMPSPQDVMAAIDDLEGLYAACTSWNGHLADAGAAFMKNELTVGDVQAIAKKICDQPYGKLILNID